MGKCIVAAEAIKHRTSPTEKKNGTSPTENTSTVESFITLGEVEDTNPHFSRSRNSGDDDGFSMVHEAHLAMRKRIPGDEMRLELSQTRQQGDAAAELLFAEGDGEEDDTANEGIDSTS